MTIRLYLDEDSENEAVLQGLRAAGVDVLTAREAGMLGASDGAQLDFAASLGRAIYTANTPDYRILNVEWLAAGREHSGIICNPEQRLPAGAQIRALLAIDASFDADGLRNLEVFVTNYLAERR